MAVFQWTLDNPQTVPGEQAKWFEFFFNFTNQNCEKYFKQILKRQKRYIYIFQLEILFFCCFKNYLEEETSVLRPAVKLNIDFISFFLNHSSGFAGSVYSYKGRYFSKYF